MLQAAGMSVTLKTQDFASFVQTVFGGSYDASCWRTDYMAPPELILSYTFAPAMFKKGHKLTGYSNSTNFSSRRILVLRKKARESSDEAVQREAYTEISRIIAAALPYVFLDYPPIALLSHADVVEQQSRLPDGTPNGTLAQSLSVGAIHWADFGLK